MKRYVLLLSALLVACAAVAQAGKPCEELKWEIAKKLEANGVKSYSLDVVAKDKDADGKVIGTCEGGSKKIVYRKTAPVSQTPPKTIGAEFSKGAPVLPRRSPIRLRWHAAQHPARRPAV